MRPLCRRTFQRDVAHRLLGGVLDLNVVEVSPLRRKPNQCFRPPASAFLTPSRDFYIALATIFQAATTHGISRIRRRYHAALRD